MLSMKYITDVRRLAYNLNRNSGFFKLNIQRSISTSEKDKVIGSEGEINLDTYVKPMKKRRPKRNWQSYGFDFVNERDDLIKMHSTVFFAITVFWLATFFWAYYPDLCDNDWFHREAVIELRRREAQGLPLVDPNYADPDSLYLPTDEELGDTEIII